MMTLDEIFDARFSVRKYKDAPVEDEKIAQIIESANKAPTAKNIQPQQIFVLKSPEAVAKIRSLARCAFDAPVVLLVCADNSQAWVNPYSQRSYAQTDAAIVTTYMMLKATELSLGTCWVGWFDPEPVKKAFALPDELEPLYLLPLGYADESFEPSPQHFHRKKIEETVKTL